jgi:PAS domain S-box-containing protein
MLLTRVLDSSRSELRAELQPVLNAVVEGVCGVDEDGNVTFCNDALLRMTGYEAGELAGNSFHELLHRSRPDGTPYPTEKCAQQKAALARQKIHAERAMLWRKDGTAFAAEYWAQPLLEGQNATVSVITIQDLTERERATEALRTREERFRQISDNLDEAFYLVDVSADRLVYASPAFEKITGRSCKEACEKPPPWRDLTVPEHREKVCANYERLVAGEGARLEYQIRRPDGSLRWINDHAKPIRDASGRVSMFAGVVEDITEIHEAREELSKSEKKFRRILSSVPSVAWTSNREGRTLYISPKVESVLGYTKPEFLTASRPFRIALVHPHDRKRVNRSYRRLFDEGKVFDEEYRIRRKDGKWIWIHDRAADTHEESGVSCADGVLSEITARKQVETELKWKTAFLEAQANSTIDGILVIDSNGRDLLHNQRFIDLFRIPPEILAPKELYVMLEYAVTLVKDPESFMAKIDYLNRHRHEIVHDEIELKNGTIVDRYSAPVLGKDDQYYGRIWIFRDITQRKRFEDALQQLSMTVDQSPVSVVITDPRGRISYVNRKFTEVTGYKPEEALGRNPRILNGRLSSPEVFRDLWTTITEGGEWRGEFCNKKKNGEIYWESATIRPIIDAKGVITHYLAIKEDITERRRAERELRLTKFSLENASDSVLWVDPEARIVYANAAACRSTGRSREELLSLTIPDIDPLFPKSAWYGIWQQIKSRGAITFESQQRNKEGRIFPVEVTANYLEFDGQEYSFAFCRDITERRTLENQLRQAQKLEGIGQLAAGIAHEINTPTQFVTDNLTFLRDSWKAAQGLLDRYRGEIHNATAALAPDVMASLEQAERDCDLDFITLEVPRAIDQALDGAGRVAKIVRAMKEFSHPDAAEKTATDLNKAIESTITVARNEWKYVAELTTELDHTLPHVICYPGDVNQVILNLLVNAAHAIKEKIQEGEKGHIKVATRKLGEFAEISVKDSGTGIPEAIRNRIFDPFFTTKEVGKGTGQGLSLAHIVVVKKHLGKIWFESEVGAGTTFFVHLPIGIEDCAKES